MPVYCNFFCKVLIFCKKHIPIHFPFRKKEKKKKQARSFRAINLGEHEGTERSAKAGVAGEASRQGRKSEADVGTALKS